MIEYSEDEVLQAQRERRQQDMLQRYRNVFGTEEGRKVLGDILVLCHFGVPITCEEQRIEYNVGVTIARMSGMLNAIDRQLGIEED